MPKKDPAQSVNHVTSNMTDLQQIINNVSDAEDAGNDLFGNVSMSKSVMNSLGSSFGFKKAIRFADFLNFQDTANLKSSKSKIIGFNNLQSKLPSSQKSNTPFMTALTSDEATALFLL